MTMEAVESPSKKAQSILDELRSIIEEQEGTIFEQQMQIESLQLDVKALTESRDSLLDKIQKMEKIISENNLHTKNHRRKSSSGKKRKSLNLHNGSGPPGDETMPTNLECSGPEAIDRSGSFQRKHLEEHDGSKYRSSGSYELSSDIRDRQVEAIRNFYGGAATSEHAARVIQEAYRSYRMRNQFKKIRKSRTRRLTLETINPSSQKKSNTVSNRSKSVDHSNDFEVVIGDAFDDATLINDDVIDMNTVEAMTSRNSQGSQDEALRDSLDILEKATEEVKNDTEEGSITPKVTSPAKNPEDIRGLTEEELTNRILNDAESPVTLKYVRRRKRHGYETVVLTNTNGEATVTTSSEPPSTATESQTTITEPIVKLRNPSGSRMAGQANNSDSDIGSRRESPAWIRTSSDLSLNGSFENEIDAESFRSSDTASVTSDMSSVIGDGPHNNMSYLRRSTISARSVSIDMNNDIYRKRLYRIGLNLFNMKPSKGLSFLIEHKFVNNTAPSVASFLLNRKGLSRQIVGEYLGNTQKIFNQEVLDSVCELMDFNGMDIDEALRTFQSQIKVQGEAQKVERLVEAFSQRYCSCNPKMIEGLQNPDSIFVLAFAIIMLNTDLHSPNMKHEKRMSEQDFIKNLRGVDNGEDLGEDLLRDIYNRLKAEELITRDDHVTQVLQVENSIVGKKPVLAVPHRRLVCFCRMYQVTDPSKPQKQGLHQREVFLFNDMMLVTKILQKKKIGTTYTYKQTISLHGLSYLVFESTNFPHGIRLVNSLDNTVLINFNAPNEHDRKKFVNDVKECIAEVQQMESLRIGAELEKATSPNEIKTNHYLTLDTKKISVSMHNLNDTNFRPESTERPTSMYDLKATLNENNNNFSSKPNGSVSKAAQRNGPRMSKLGTIFATYSGRKSRLRGQSKLSGSMSSLATNGSSPSITFTLHKGHEI